MLPLPRRSIIAAVLGACTIGANADLQSATGLEVNAIPISISANGAFPVADVDLSDRVHNNVLNSAWNTVICFDLGGTNFRLTGVAWDLEATTRAGVALSELWLAVFNAEGKGILFNPFDGNDTVGTGQALSGMHDLVGPGMAFDAPTGEVFIELYLPRNVIAGAEGWYAQGSVLSLEYATQNQTVVLSTGFEPPTYTSGDISGQDGWMVTPMNAQGLVQTGIVHTGDHAMELIDGASFARAQHEATAELTGRLVRAQFDMFVPVTWRETGAEPVEDRFEAQMRLEFTGAGETFGVEFGFITTTIDYQAMPAGTSAYYIEITRGESIHTSAYTLVDYAAAAGAWNHYRLDLSPTGAALLYVNDAIVADVTAIGQFSDLSVAQLQNQRWGTSPLGNDSVCFDNVAITIGGDASCNAADLATPFGTLDFSDVILFLVAFDEGSPVADLAEPLGVLDYSDVLSYLVTFGAGCP